MILNSDAISSRNVNSTIYQVYRFMTPTNVLAAVAEQLWCHQQPLSGFVQVAYLAHTRERAVDMDAV